MYLLIIEDSQEKVTYRYASLKTEYTQRLIGGVTSLWSLHVLLLVGWSVSHNFQKKVQEFTLPWSYRRTCFTYMLCSPTSHGGQVSAVSAHGLHDEDTPLGALRRLTNPRLSNAMKQIKNRQGPQKLFTIEFFLIELQRKCEIVRRYL